MILEKDGRYDYTTTDPAAKGRMKQWFRMTVVHFEPDLQKAWVFMEESKRHRVLETNDKKFVKVD